MKNIRGFKLTKNNDLVGYWFYIPKDISKVSKDVKINIDVEFKLNIINNKDFNLVEIFLKDEDSFDKTLHLKNSKLKSDSGCIFEIIFEEF